MVKASLPEHLMALLDERRMWVNRTLPNDYPEFGRSLYEKYAASSECAVASIDKEIEETVSILKSQKIIT